MEGYPGIREIENQEIQEAARNYYQEEVKKKKNQPQQKKQEAKAEPKEPVDWYQGNAIKGAAAGAADNANAPGSEILIDKNGTKMTASEVAAIAEIFKAAGKSGMKSDELVAKLKEKGIDAYATQINGKMAIKFANGNTFVDTSGNGILDSDDQEWTEAVKMLQQKYGGDYGALAKQAGGDNNFDAKAIKAGAMDNILATNLPKKLTNPAAKLQEPAGAGEKQQGARVNLQDVFADLDRQLVAAGYEGPMSEDLYAKGELDQVLEKYGIANTQFNQGNDGVSEYINALFRFALQIAQVKQAAFV